jgi:hypothetical protein
MSTQIETTASLVVKPSSLDADTIPYLTLVREWYAENGNAQHPNMAYVEMEEHLLVVELDGHQRDSWGEIIRGMVKVVGGRFQVQRIGWVSEAWSSKQKRVRPSRARDRREIVSIAVETASGRQAWAIPLDRKQAEPLGEPEPLTAIDSEYLGHLWRPEWN